MRTYSSSALFIRSFILKCIIRCHPAEVNNLSDRTGRACPAPFAYAPLAPSEARISPFPRDKRPAILSHAPAFSARRARLQLRSSSSAVLFLFLLISLDKGQNPWPDRQPLPPSIKETRHTLIFADQNMRRMQVAMDQRGKIRPVRTVIYPRLPSFPKRL